MIRRSLRTGSASLVHADYRVEKMASDIGTIPYEIMTGLGHRAERYYRVAASTLAIIGHSGFTMVCLFSQHFSSNHLSRVRLHVPSDIPSLGLAFGLYS